MHILFFLSRSDQVGGAHIHVRDLTLKLLACNHQITLVVGGNGRYLDLFEGLRINIVTIPSLFRSLNFFKDLQALSHLYKVIRTTKPDLISSHSFKAGLISRLLFPFISSPLLFTAHGWSFTPGTPLLQRLSGYFFEFFLSILCSRIICVSLFDYRLAARFLPHTINKTICVQNGMPDLTDTTSYRSSSRTFTILSVARFECQKDHQTLLLAFQNFLESIYPAKAKLVLVGDGPLMTSAISFVEIHGLSESVVFVGSTTDVVKYYSSSDLFVLSTFWEGLPRSLIEALRSSLPVIATDVGGCSECVLHGVNGYLFPRRNYALLQSYLYQVYSDCSLQLSFSRNSRSLYLNHFTFEHMYNSTFNVYSSLLSE